MEIKYNFSSISTMPSPLCVLLKQLEIDITLEYQMNIHFRLCKHILEDFVQSNIH